MNPDVLALLERLVGFPTISDRSNLELADFIADYLRVLGARPRLFRDKVEDKAGLFVSFGPAVPGGVVLSGHSDVVPVDDQPWTGDPFTLRRSNDRFFGRGTCDMKGFLALCLAKARAFEDAPLKRPIHLAISYDEETTCEGVLPLIEHLGQSVPPVRAVIVGEPSGMDIFNRHNGYFGWHVRVRGVAAHSSRPRLGASATALAARLMVWVDECQRRFLAAAQTGSGPGECTTCHVSTVSGGGAVNIIADECAFDWDLRPLPTDDHKSVLDAFRAEADRLVGDPVFRGAAVVIVEEFGVAGLAAEPDGAAEALCRDLLPNSSVQGAGFFSEAGIFQRAGHSTVIVGPGAIDQAHTADEYITLDQLVAFDGFLDRLIARQCRD